MRGFGSHGKYRHGRGGPVQRNWFEDAALGLFIHWDHASQQGLEISWPMVGFLASGEPMDPPVTIEQYNSSAEAFNPTNWDPGKLASLARDCGFRYAVLTAKHHTGYCMFHTELSSFSIESSAYGRDVVKEYTEAFRAAGLRVGLYFSLSDWHHPDYPAIAEGDLPYVVGQTPAFPGAASWERYLTFMHGQLRELLTNYGKIDLLWFDGDWERTAAQWRSHEIAELVRSLQPDIILNDRLPGEGDYSTPEQIVPATNGAGSWESCMTMNETWAYDPGDQAYKSTGLIVQRLIETVAGGGNLLLDVSPMGDGSLPIEQTERLEGIGEWLASNGASIYGAQPGLEPGQFYGPTTRRGSTIYLHVLMNPSEVLDVRRVPIRRVKRVYELGAQADLDWRTRLELHSQSQAKGEVLGNLEIRTPEDPRRSLPFVIAVEFETSS